VHVAGHRVGDVWPHARSRGRLKLFTSPRPRIADRMEAELLPATIGAKKVSAQNIGEVNTEAPALHQSPYYRLHRNDLQPVPPPRTTQSRVDLANVLGADFLAPIVAGKKLSFPRGRDSGAAEGEQLPDGRAIGMRAASPTRWPATCTQGPRPARVLLPPRDVI